MARSLLPGEKRDAAFVPATPNVDTITYFSGIMDVIINAAEIGMWDWHLPSGRVIYSKQWEHIAGYEEGELPQVIETWDNSVLPDDLELANQRIRDYLDGKTERYEAEFRMRRKDGSVIWAQDRGIVTEWSEDGNPVRLVGVLQDVTRIKRAEELVKEKSEQLDFVARLSGLGTWDWDLTTNTIRYSTDYLTMMGYSPDEVTGTYHEWEQLSHPDDLAEAAKKLDDYVSGRSSAYSHTMRMKHSDGHYVWTLDTGRISNWDAKGKPTRMLGGHLNIDTIKHTQERLQEALAENERYNERLQREIEAAVQNLDDTRLLNQTMFDANPYVNVVFNDKLEVINCNPAAIEYFGFSSKQDLLDNLVPLVSKSIPEYQPMGRISISMAERMQYAIEHGYHEFETELVLGGVLTPMRIVLKRIPLKDTFYIAIYQLDLRSLKEAKNELIRQDRLLQAVNHVASELMASNQDEFDQAMGEALKTLARSVHADRAYVWRNVSHNDKPCAQQVCEWNESGYTAWQNNQGELLAYSSAPEEWRGALLEGKLLYYEKGDLKPVYDVFPALRQAVSLSILPIILQGDFWGFIGLENHTGAHVFTETEQDILKSGGLLVASAIARNEMTANLIASKETALESTRAKSDFLSRMSHEIRTPMNAIIGMTTIAKKASEMDRVAYCLEKIDNASQQLLGIINDVLDMSKIEANKFEIVDNEFNFEKMMQNVFNVIQVKLDEKKQDFTFDFEDMFTRAVVCDELRLSQVMINLLSNAVKFTPEKGSISLKVRHRTFGADAALLHVEVRDSGIGISPEQQKRLFSSFEQADGGITRKYGGTGLGLAICKKIVNLMDGDIWVESVPGEGSCFAFDVKFRWGEVLQEGVAKKELRKDVRILVVDDSEDVLDYFRNILSSFSLGCDAVGCGEVALEKVTEKLAMGEPYDIIFLDWRMPGMDGAETARQIKHIMDDNVIVVMISVADWSEIEEEVKPIGVNHFLSKPVLPSALYNTIVELTEQDLVTPSTRKPEESGRDWTGKNILVVEDIEINREIITSILEETGIAIDCACDGAEGVRMYRAHPRRYALILMDLQMPELDGFGATRQIRTSGLEGARTIPIIAMTANAFKEDVQACIAAGMDNHVAKPFDVDDLMDKLSLYLGG